MYTWLWAPPFRFLNATTWIYKIFTSSVYSFLWDTENFTKQRDIFLQLQTDTSDDIVVHVFRWVILFGTHTAGFLFGLGSS